MRVFPWRPRSERRKDVKEAWDRAEEARERAEEARKRTERTAGLKEDLLRMAHDNHFARAIYEDITGKPIPE